MPAIPLVELHGHLEGSLTPRRLIALAERHGRSDIPRAVLDPAGKAFVSRGFDGFLELYKAVTACLLTPADHHEVGLDLGRALAREGVVYAETIVAYGVLQKRGIDPLPVQAALAEAAAETAERHGVIMRWLPDAVRQFGVDAARRAAAAAVDAGPRLGVVGFGIGGDEAALPAEAFAAVCDEARAGGLGIALHAGEAAGPDSVRQAVAACGATRIGHGVAAAADPGVMALLRAAGVFVELCPGSNLRTGAVASPAAHPLRDFLDAGIPCCLNTDDRGLFGLDLPGEYAWAARWHGLTPAQATAMQRQAIAAGFAEPQAKAAVLARLA